MLVWVSEQSLPLHPTLYWVLSKVEKKHTANVTSTQSSYAEPYTHTHTHTHTNIHTHEHTPTIRQRICNDCSRMDKKCRLSAYEINDRSCAANAAVTQQWGLDDILKIIKRRHLDLFAHVARLQPEVPGTSVLSACHADTPQMAGVAHAVDTLSTGYTKSQLISTWIK